MTYSAGGLIQASDYNLLVGTYDSPSTAANKLNTIWGIGTERWGYGQPAIPHVTADATISYDAWASLTSRINIINRHQVGVITAKTGTATTGSAVITMASTTGIAKGQYISGTGVPSNVLVTVVSIVTNVSITVSTTANASGSATFVFTQTPPLIIPATNDKITYLDKLVTQLTTQYTNKNNAAAQGPTSTTVTRYLPSAWKNSITFTHTITFQSADKTRYFFNAGGQIALNFTHAATGTPVDKMFSDLASQCGTLVLSAPPYGTRCSITGTEYYGFTKVGGSGTATIKRIGYYDLTTEDQLAFKQFAPITGGVRGYYIESNISVNIKSNGTQGTNSDAGSIITVTTVWDQVPNGLNVSPGNNTGPVNNSTTTVVVRYPIDNTSNGYLTNTWGTVSVVGSVTGN